MKLPPDQDALQVSLPKLKHGVRRPHRAGSEANPTWEETTAILDSDRLTMDDHLGTLDFRLKNIMKHSTNRLSAHQDCLNKIDGTPFHGVLFWECGYFSKTMLKRRKKKSASKF
ncbi:hypothetical protein DXG01_008279 [Tephrocybe rancida]|nr:hypothetical protein DXG01_008279 [Tephrocybe rancida]